MSVEFLAPAAHGDDAAADVPSPRRVTLVHKHIEGDAPLLLVEVNSEKRRREMGLKCDAFERKLSVVDFFLLAGFVHRKG